MGAAGIRIPAMFALGLIDFFAEIADKDFHISIWHLDIALFLYPLELLLNLLVVAYTAFGCRRHLDAVIYC